jgi:hypothetical protein
MNELKVGVVGPTHHWTQNWVRLNSEGHIPVGAKVFTFSASESSRLEGVRLDVWILLSPVSWPVKVDYDQLGVPFYFSPVAQAISRSAALNRSSVEVIHNS